MPGGDTGIDAEATMELCTKFNDLEEKMMMLSEAAQQLQDEKHDRDKHLEVMRPPTIFIDK